jgi:hypothetical protein
VSQPNTAWIGFNSTGTADIMTLTNNTQAPVPINIFCQATTAYNGQFHGDWLLRPVTQAGPVVLGTVFCAGDGVLPHTACPCGNNSAVADGVGCLSSLNLGGKLRGTGVASITGDTAILQGSQMPNSTCLYFQGTISRAGGSGTAFGDGTLRRRSIRLGQTLNVAGNSTYPFGARSVGQRQGHGDGTGHAHVPRLVPQRGEFCTPSTFNDGLELR